MADNETTGTGKAVATDKVTYSGDADQNVQLVRVVLVSGAEGSKTVVDPGGDTSGLKVQLGNITPLTWGNGDGITSANVTAASTQAQLMAFNGTTTDRIRGDTTNGIDVDVTRTPKAATATLANVSGSASSVTLLSSNSSRLGATIVNDSSAVLYVKFGTTASTTSFTYKLNANDTLELPTPIYSGRIDGIWASATGSARTTEMT